MLRITLQDDAHAQTLLLEGGLAGPWVSEAETCRQQTLARNPNRPLVLNLTGVTLIDAAGKAFLARAHTQGARLIASDCFMRAIVVGISQSARPAGAEFNAADSNSFDDVPASANDWSMDA